MLRKQKAFSVKEKKRKKKRKYDYAENTRMVSSLLQNGRPAQQCSAVDQTTIK